MVFRKFSQGFNSIHVPVDNAGTSNPSTLNFSNIHKMTVPVNESHYETYLHTVGVMKDKL